MNEYDSDYEKKKIDQMDKEITDLLKNHKEYFINTGSETKDGEKERKKLENARETLKFKLNLPISLSLKGTAMKKLSNQTLMMNQVITISPIFACLIYISIFNSDC